MSLTFALVGNQNCGKSTLFNYLTGSNQHVGNFPGVTVQKKEGRLLNNKDVTVIDLPGIYSLSPYTSEEIVTRQFLLESRTDLPKTSVYSLGRSSSTNNFARMASSISSTLPILNAVSIFPCSSSNSTPR